LEGSVAVVSAFVEQHPKCPRGSGEESIECEAERGILLVVSHLTMKWKNQTGSQKKQAKKRNAVRKETEGSAGSAPPLSLHFFSTLIFSSRA
jgi:hypothetical protein